MKINCSLFISLLCMLLISCTNSNSVFQIGKRIVSSCDAVPEITISPIDSITGECLESVIGCGVSDSIIVFTLKDGPFRFRALSLKSGHYVDFLRIGRGPDEISTGLLSRIRKIGDNPVVDIDAPNERVIITVDLKETLRKGTAAIIKKTQTPVHAMKSFIIGENILSEVVFDEDIYSLKTFDGATLELLRKEQIYGQEEYLTSLQPLFGSVIKVNPNESRVSMGMICFDEINIYDISSENHKSITTSNSSSSYSTIKTLLSTKSCGRS